MSEKLASSEGELNAIVKEYMEHLKLEDSVHSFEAECRKKGRPIQENVTKFRIDDETRKVQKEFFEKLEKGQCSEFFSLWDSQVGSDVLDQNPEAQKLEFLLHVYFATYPLRKTNHWVQEEAEEAMFQFRYYLETGGLAMSSLPDLLPFFALPYIQAPSSHPSFQEILQESWTKELKQNLLTFLNIHIKSREIKDDTPRLVQLYISNETELKDSKSELKAMERRMEKCKHCYAAKSKKLDMLQEDCRQLMSLSNLLLTALESALKGDFRDLDYVLSSCADRFPGALCLKNGFNKMSVSISESDDGSTIGIQKEISNVNRDQYMKAGFNLNFNKIRNDMCYSNERTQLLLLQALRWRLTKYETKELKAKTVEMYIENDLLFLKDVTNKKLKFVQIMWTASLNLRQCIARFVNAFASFIKGREYLSQSPELLRALMSNLMEFKAKDTLITDMTLAALQKLSIRPVCQFVMIETGFMEWLTELLRKFEKLSDYGQEYSVALLMNCCMCELGQMKGELIKENLFPVLLKLLSVDKRKILGYVIGALYSLISKPAIKQWAMKNEVEKSLQDYLKRYDADIKRQLQCVVDALNSDGDVTPTSSSDEDTVDKEETDIEGELELNDPVNALPNEPSGEKLLWKYYSTPLNIHLSIDNYSVPENLSPVNENPMEVSTPHLLLSPARISEPRRNSKINLEKDIGQSFESNDSIHSTDNVNQPVSAPVSPKVDLEATDLVRKIVGKDTSTLVEAAMTPDPTSANIKGLDSNEFLVAFSSRPKIPRTPELQSPGGSRRHQVLSPASTYEISPTLRKRDYNTSDFD